MYSYIRIHVVNHCCCCCILADFPNKSDSKLCSAQNFSVSKSTHNVREMFIVCNVKTFSALIIIVCFTFFFVAFLCIYFWNEEEVSYCLRNFSENVCLPLIRPFENCCKFALNGF